jgi:hypothetical protein
MAASLFVLPFKILWLLSPPSNKAQSLNLLKIDLRETGGFKGLALSNSGPVLFRKPGLFFRQGADRVSAPTHGV